MAPLESPQIHNNLANGFTAEHVIDRISNRVQTSERLWINPCADLASVVLVKDPLQGVHILLALLHSRKNQVGAFLLQALASC